MKTLWIDKSFIPFAVIAIAGLLLYAQTFSFGFSYLDDDALILNNAYFLSNPGSIIDSFRYDVGGPPSTSSGSYGFYRPILTLSFIFDYALGGANPAVYHATNIILHIVVAELLFVLFRAFSVNRRASFGLALLFLIHPIVLSVAAWIPGRNDALLAIGVFGSLFFFITFWKEPRFLYFLLHQVFFLCALFTKETAFVLPLLCSLYVVLIAKERIFVFNRRRVMFIVCWVILLISWVVMRQAALPDNHTTIAPAGIVSSITMNAPGAFSYLGKAFFPFKLSVYPIRQDILIWPGVLVAFFLVLGFVFSSVKKRRTMLFGLCWFVLFIIPGLVNTQEVLKADFAEHRAYIPLFGLVLFLSQVPFERMMPERSERYWQTIIFGALVVFYGVTNIYHAGVYRNAKNFWTNAVQTSPHASAAHNGLGAYYYLEGELDRSAEEFQKAIALNDSGSEYHYNLGMVYLQKNMYAQAEQEFKKEIAANASYIKAYLNLGVVYYFTGNTQEAEIAWLEGLKINPHYHDIHNNLAYLYYQQGKREEALRHARIILDDGGALREQVRKALEP
ncbi:MAG: tetratricopeptide repeat protein [Patescibacteria group bacterium]